jgi:hypothetical protein
VPSISKLSRFRGEKLTEVGPQPDRVWSSLERHHHLSESAALTNTRKRGGYLLECEDLVNVDPHLSSDAEVGKRLEVRRTLLHCQHADRPSGESASHHADGEDPQHCARRPAHTAVRSAWRQCTPVSEH